MSRHILLGLPRVGKSTFLAALWHALTSEEVPTSLRLESLEGNMEYINEIRDKWLEGKDLTRTVLKDGAPETVTLALCDHAGNTIGRVVVPDFDGEEFRQQWTDRRASQYFCDAAAGASGLLIFIHPGKISKPILLETVNETLKLLKNSGLSVDRGASNSKEVSSKTEANLPADGHPEKGESIESLDLNPAEVISSPQSAADIAQRIAQRFELKGCPTQVSLVDLLQFLCHDLELKAPARLAVVVSAWDLVCGAYQGVTPSDWLDTSLPMLSQFLSARTEFFTTKIFGVSAQGGRLPAERSRLLELEKPSDRILVVWDDRQSNDITEPIKWICGLE